MIQKTLGIRILEGKRIQHSVLSYDVEFRNAETVAQALGLPCELVYKTLVVTRHGRKPMLIMLPANRQLNLKRVAKEVGEKRVKMASHREAEELTGLKIGGISALGLLNRGFSIFLEESAMDHELICISAGVRGSQIQLAPSDLILATNARRLKLID
jgi:Cys-tRNA(Pro)/Cys-tRNA(Cys) deacylase